MINNLINGPIAHIRTLVLSLIVLTIVGIYSYTTIPKEAFPRIAFKVIHIYITHIGLANQDAEKSLIIPIEDQIIKDIRGIDKIESYVEKNYSRIFLTFKQDTDIDEAELNIEESIDKVFPSFSSLIDQEDIMVIKIVPAELTPMIRVSLLGQMPPETLKALVKDLKLGIKKIDGIDRINVRGESIPITEIILNKSVIEAYSITPDLIRKTLQNAETTLQNVVIENTDSEYNIITPSGLMSLQDIENLPILTDSQGKVIVLSDIATVRNIFKKPSQENRVNGKNIVSLEIYNQDNSDIISITKEIEEYTKEFNKTLPEGIEAVVYNKMSDGIESQLKTLSNSVLNSIFLVMLLIFIAIGLYSSILVGITIPLSFLMGILLLNYFDLSLNVIVLFGLVLSIGMLVDSAIIVIEYANQKIEENYSINDSYSLAAQYMAWPIITSTTTTLIAFAPLLFWNSDIGSFMRFIPITLILIMIGSTFIALFCVPGIGVLFTKLISKKARNQNQDISEKTYFPQLHEVGGIQGAYGRIVNFIISKVWVSILLCVAIIVSIVITFLQYKSSITNATQFSESGVNNLEITVTADDALSADEKYKLVNRVEQEIMQIKELTLVQTKVYSIQQTTKTTTRNTVSNIAKISLDLNQMDVQEYAEEIVDKLEAIDENIKEITFYISKLRGGPPTQKDINFQASSKNSKLLNETFDRVLAYLRSQPQINSIRDNRSKDGFDMKLTFDKSQLMVMGLGNYFSINDFFQLSTDDVKVGEYMPLNQNEKIDIILRLPENDTSIDSLNQIQLPSSNGLTPITEIAQVSTTLKDQLIKRIDGERIISLSANIDKSAKKILVLEDLKDWIKQQNFSNEVKLSFEGANRGSSEDSTFFISSFSLALCVIFIVLLTQFNSIYYSFITLTSVPLSILGVMLGFILTGTADTLVTVMMGIGVMTLAGIVVNNNIVLIETYKRFKDEEGLEPIYAIILSSMQRLRPIVLTTTTTVIGMIPVAMEVNINLFNGSYKIPDLDISYFSVLAQTIVYGLSCSMILTLFLTPTLLAFGVYTNRFFSRWRHQEKFENSEVTL